MSLFSIKLKTKNGNDVKKKESITVFFRLKYKAGLKVTAEYTYRIIHSRGIDDPRKVLQLQAAKDVTCIEDLTLKVMLNLCHILGKITKVHNITPDFVMFMSTDLGGKDKKGKEFNKAWHFLRDALAKPKPDKDKKGNIKDLDKYDFSALSNVIGEEYEDT